MKVIENAAAVRGDKWQATITVRDSSGAVIDLTGYTITARAALPSGNASFALDVERDDTHGAVTISAARALTAQWVEQHVTFDVLLSEPDGRDLRTPMFLLPVRGGVS